MLRITAVSAGAVDYLLKGSGCAHEHSPEQQQQDAPGYYLSATEHGEAPGMWLGDGLSTLGMAAGSAAAADDVRAVFGELKHPETGEHLGRAPRTFKGYQERLQAALAAEPEATPERQREIETSVRQGGRKATAYYDATFSPVKSVSVYHAALGAAGRVEDAAKVLEAQQFAVNVALKVAEDHAAYTRVGYHGTTANGRSVGRYERATGLIATGWLHSTNRENEPQIHTHVAILNRVQTASDGQIRALDGKSFRPIKEAMASAYERALEGRLTETLGVVFATRPDGKAREILGVDPELCASASTRRSQVEERSEELIEAYVDQHGRVPGPAAMKAIRQAATLETRQAKGAEAGPGAVREWAEQRAGKMAATLDSVQEAAERVARSGVHPDALVLPDQSNPEAIVRAAIEEVQGTYATWTLGNLMDAIDRKTLVVAGPAEERPRRIEEMAREAVKPGNRHGALQLTASDLVEVPQQLRRADDDRSVYRPHIDERYATEAHLSTENRIVVGARQQTAPRVQGPELELLRVELGSAGLGEDQAAAVLGVMASGRAGDVLIGPAGAGKSHTVGVLARTWEAHHGGRVVGLATSQRATQVLAEDGLEALNTAQFRKRFGSAGRDEVRPGDLFVVDESGMSSTAELAEIQRLVADGGGKLLFTGDHHQLTSIGSGGMLELLARDNGAFELAEIHRFANDWEKDASARLRTGDATVIRQYEDRGRLRGGTLEEMQDAAMRGYLADTVTGRESLLIVATNDEASALSREIRDQLIELGQVDGGDLARLRDSNFISAGDVIQARRNDYDLGVVNRGTYRVIGLDDLGQVQVRRADGAVLALPDSYVSENVTLAYASTIYAAQGRTVDTSHEVLGEHTEREDAYVALTRGRQCNTAYLVTERAPDAHEPERLDVTPAGQLAEILDNTGADRTAELEHRIGQDEARSLAVLGTQWDLVTKEYARDRYTDALSELLAPEVMDRVVAEQGYDRLMRAVRASELVGHSPEAVLREAVDARGLLGAQSVSDVLRWRVRRDVDERAPEQEVDPRNWTTLAAPIEGPVGQFAHELAVAASDRQQAIGDRAAVELPGWAVAHLGLPPEEPDQRAEWTRRAGVAGAYREMHNIPETTVALGAAPSREQEFHHTLWQQAHAALGSPTDQLDYLAASDADLRAMCQEWKRDQTWAPAYVADDLRRAYELAEGYRQDAALFALHQPADAIGHEEARADVARAERLAAEFGERARQLEEIHGARERWHAATENSRIRDQLATAEMDRRGLTLDSEQATPAEQLSLFRVATEYEPQQIDEWGRTAERAEEREAEAAQPRPAAEAEPGEHVRWWQRWADRLTGRGEREAEQDVERTMDGTDATELYADPEIVEVAARQTEAGESSAVAEQGREPEVRVEVDPNQMALFDAEPQVADQVGVQQVHQDIEQERSDGGDVAVTLAEARQQARAADSQRQQREAAEAIRMERHAARTAAELTEVDRARRDTVETPVERSASPTREQKQDEPEIELVQRAAAEPAPQQGPGRSR